MIALLLALAATSGGYKLVLAVNDSVVVVDYPSLSRCEQAKAIAEAEVRKRYEDAQRNAAPGVIITKPAISAAGICIPG